MFQQRLFGVNGSVLGMVGFKVHLLDKSLDHILCACLQYMYIHICYHDTLKNLSLSIQCCLVKQMLILQDFKIILTLTINFQNLWFYDIAFKIKKK